MKDKLEWFIIIALLIGALFAYQLQLTAPQQYCQQNPAAYYCN